MYRDYNDPLYKKFRQEVRKRDKYKCRWVGCKCKKRLHVHHILPWDKSPLLRYEVSNGILLCRFHHRLVTGNEMVYAKTFMRILNGV